ncbi:MAG: hypothetical protein ACOCT9_02380 [archaeon]
MSKEDVNVFKKATSRKVGTFKDDHLQKVNSSEQSSHIYKKVLETKVQETEDWMTSVMKKAILKHQELEKECDKAAKMQPDVVRFNEQGVKQTSYSEEAWKKKSEPFNNLKKLAQQIDKAFDNCTIQEFENLEKMLK